MTAQAGPSSVTVEKSCRPVGRDLGSHYHLLELIGNGQSSPRCFMHNGAIQTLPDLTKRPDFREKGPGRALLVGQVPDFVGDVRWFYEVVIGFVRVPLPRPRKIDHRVDHEEGDMHAPGPHLSGHRLRQDALRRLGRCESREPRLAPDR